MQITITWRRFAFTLAAVLAVVFVALLAGCGNQGHGDSAINQEDHGPAATIDFPDGFRNVARKCDGPNMVYSASRGVGSDYAAVPGAVAVVPNDPRCPGAVTK